MSAAKIVGALRKAYPFPDYGFATEVAQATGFDARRHLDVVIMDTWPSRGLELMGVEIKISASDLSRELAQPAKAEEIARFCNSFWLATPAGLVKDVSKLPFSWGLLEVDESGSVSKKIAAKRKDAQPLTKEFAAALLRGARRAPDANEASEALAATARQQREALELEFEQRVAKRSSDNCRDASQHRQLREKLGDKYGFLENDRIITALKIVMDCGLHEGWGGIQGLGHSLKGACSQVDEMLVAAGLEPVTGVKLKKRLNP